MLSSTSSLIANNSPYNEPNVFLDQYRNINRLIVIGNGFDLSHGLKSTYQDFYLYLMSSFILETEIVNYDFSFPSKIFKLSMPKNYHPSEFYSFKEELIGSIKELNKVDFEIFKRYGVSITGNNAFSRDILNNMKSSSWMDFESLYFKHLVEDRNIDEINNTLEILHEYFCAFLESALSDLTFYKNSKLNDQMTELSKHRDAPPNTIQSNIQPSDIKILNFNYTDIARDYIGSKISDIIYIHGRLVNIGSNEQAPVFGYGDESDPRLQRIEEQLGGTDHLINIKSIRYMESDQFDKLAKFLADKPFEVYIFGHSCGLIDRTLFQYILNNSNCFKVKYFYYKTEAGDDFMEKMRNLYRYFSDKNRFREIVAKKLKSQAMAQVD